MKIDLPALVCARLASLSLASMCVMMSALMALGASPALAQDDALKPPRAKELTGGGFMIYAVAILLVGAVVFVATLKTKRGHQD